MLLRPLVRVLNHLLAQEDWARERLKSFAGQSVCLRLSAFSLPLAVRPDGLFALGDGDAVAATVTITLPPDAPLRTLADRQAVLAAAHIAGPAEFAETLGFVFRNLDWDAESDLARVVGDVADFCAQSAALTAEVAALEARIARLER